MKSVEVCWSTKKKNNNYETILKMNSLLVHLNAYLIETFIADVLSNLTHLKTLDLSYNEIDMLDTIDTKFNFPANLTELHITNNRLRRLPMHVFKNASTMATIDIRNNSIVSFEPSLLRNIKTGLQLFITGNLSFVFVCVGCS